MNSDELERRQYRLGYARFRNKVMRQLKCKYASFDSWTDNKAIINNLILIEIEMFIPYSLGFSQEEGILVSISDWWKFRRFLKGKKHWRKIYTLSWKKGFLVRDYGKEKLNKVFKAIDELTELCKGSSA